MQAYFMRHGRTNYNDLGLCNDNPRSDIHLTDTGKQQAMAAAERLRETKLNRIIVSPLPRTKQTADIINRYHHAPIEAHADIADIRSGFDGKPVEEYFSAIADDPLNARINGGESLLDHKQRVTQFINWLKQQEDDAVLVVAHEETLRVFIAHFEGNIADEQLREIHIDNCEFVQYSL